MALAFPGLLLALVIVARLGPSLDNAIIAMGLVSVPVFACQFSISTNSPHRGKIYFGSAIILQRLKD